MKIPRNSMKIVRLHNQPHDLHGVAGNFHARGGTMISTVDNDHFARQELCVHDVIV